VRAHDDRIDILFLGRHANHPGGVSVRLEHFRAHRFRSLWDPFLVSARRQIGDRHRIDRSEAARRHLRHYVAANVDHYKFCTRKKAFRFVCRSEGDGRLIESDKDLRHVLSFLWILHRRITDARVATTVTG
jgi:hypothetical protein